MKAVDPIHAILEGQMETDAWSGERSYYTPNYSSTHWSMLLLSELFAGPSDVRLLRGMEYMLIKTDQEAAEQVIESQHGLECF
jgi:hypothetical protein